MLEAMLDALCSGLRSQGVSALRAYPDARLDSMEPAVAVSLKKATVASGGFGDYLGERDGLGVQGLVCDAKFALEIWAPAAGGSVAVSVETDRLFSALWALSGGFGPGCFSIGEVGYDRALDRLCCGCELTARFWLLRESEDGPEIEKFTVKGMILHGNE